MEVLANVIVQAIANIQDEDEDDEEMLQMCLSNYREEHEKIEFYSENVVPFYNITDFASHFRMEKKTFEALLQFLGPRDAVYATRRPAVSLEKQLQICIWTLANQEVYRSISDRFGVSKSTVWTCLFRICNILTDNVGDFIKWPRDDIGREEQNKWRAQSGLTGVCGAIDGCLIPISAPSHYQESYVCRKKYHAITLQGVCNSDKKFIDVDVGTPGSVHDARVFRKSDLLNMIREDKTSMFPDDGYMIGDSAYPCLDVLIVPFKGTNLSPLQKRFNNKLSGSRVLIEQTFGILLSRFRRLKYVYMRRTDLIPLIILSSCIIHNICIDNADIIESEYDANMFSNNNLGTINIRQGDVSGVTKRNDILSSL